ncbi:GNAT family N-acetyltransferase [Frigoriglobus tundricola]|uniref:GNAT family N-acetyltransferase n=1 Tax=Frigoriglobus tundricola TaxID=2774151 RepID=UPI001D0789D6|nr:GNAT family N-acetyltransferase [Frigoriglobus tundricola]
MDDWLKTKALQHQDKHLSVTKVLLDDSSGIAGYFTLATGQVDFGDLPADVAKKLPKRMLPVAVLAWLGVSAAKHGQGLGKSLLAQALRDCHEAGQTFAFIAVILDCIDDKAKAFYRHFDFTELPGHPYRLFIPVAQLETSSRSQVRRRHISELICRRREGIRIRPGAVSVPARHCGVRGWRR